MENDKVARPLNLIIAEYLILLCDVLLFASAINCLFQTLSYARTFDIVLFIISVLLGVVVYLYSMNVKRNPKLQLRVVIAVSSVVVWAILIPVLYSFFN